MYFPFNSELCPTIQAQLRDYPFGVAERFVCCSGSMCNAPPPPPAPTPTPALAAGCVGAGAGAAGERCCVRVLGTPGATLLWTVPAGEWLTSIAVWDDSDSEATGGGSPLLQSTAQLEGLGVMLLSGGSATGCALLPRAPARPGYTALSVACGPPPAGGGGYRVALSMPGLPAARPAARVAVRACSSASGGDAVLWVEGVLPGA